MFKMLKTQILLINKLKINVYIYKVIKEDGEEYIEPIEDDKEFEEISETFEDRLSELYDSEED